MKQREVIENRLLKLVGRHEREFILEQTDRVPHNCVHNILDEPKSYDLTAVDHDLAPRRSVSLVVLNHQASVRLCGLGGQWNGNICNDASVSSQCPYFQGRSNESQSRSKFSELLMDDEHVAAHYPDIAELQWVLDTRYHEMIHDLSSANVGQLTPTNLDDFDESQSAGIRTYSTPSVWTRLVRLFQKWAGL